jgi:hypothetical protein
VLTATTTYSLSCTGPGGPSNVATASVTITSGTVTVSPAVVGLTVTQIQQFTASVASTWKVDGVAGGNASVGLINSTGLYTAGTAPGTHTILATSGGNSGTATVGVTDLPGMYTYHNDLSRDGANIKEYALTTSNVKTATFGKLASCTVDGAIYGQPLWVANLMVGGTRHNVVIVATQHDSLYAFDADANSCALLWHTNLIDAAHGGAAGETSVPNGLVNSGDVSPEIGVTSTPVIDPSTSILYVLSKSVDSTQANYYQRLHAIDLATGNEKTLSPVLIVASVPGAAAGGTTVSFSARMEGQRAGLALVNGTVYVAWASHGDTTPFFGWMMGYRYSAAAGFAAPVIFNAAPHTGKAGIWMTGNAPAADLNNNLYVVTGNGNFDVPNGDYGDSLLQLTANLTVLHYYTPSDQASDNSIDFDFGSGGAALLADLPSTSPVTHLLICGGKSGDVYVLNRDNLGGYDVNTTLAVQKFYSGSSIFSSGAFWNNNFYIGVIDKVMSAYKLNVSTSQFNPTASSTSPSATLFHEGGGTPSVSAAGTLNGIVWALDNSNYCTSGHPVCGPTVLHAYDATDLATELWNSAASVTDKAGNAIKFTVPTVANGKVYVGTRGNNTGGVFGSTTVSGELDIYGLKP